jgi:uncharacterized protein YcbK (DUF882 family)
MEISRRHLIGSAIATFAAAPVVARAAGLSAVDVKTATRELAFYHTHTSEKIRLAYFDNGQYQHDALAELNRFLRDWRTGAVHDIAPDLLDQLYALQTKVATPGAFNVICGYRAPETNENLRGHSGGVAKHSLHMEGRAIDLSLPGRDLAQLHSAAVGLKAGGVGYYPASGFIHMDTGRVRYWS